MASPTLVCAAQTDVYGIHFDTKHELLIQFSMKKVIHRPQVVTCGLCDRFIIIYSSLKSLYIDTPAVYFPRRDQISNGEEGIWNDVKEGSRR